MMPGPGSENLARNPISRPIPGRTGGIVDRILDYFFLSLSCLLFRPGHPCREGIRAGVKTEAAPAAASVASASPARRATRAR